MYVGIYEHNIDAKGRIILPGTFGQALGSPFIISAGFDQCLSLWNRDEWSNFVGRELERHSDLSARARRISRTLHALAQETKPDSQRRFLISPPLRDYAALKKEVVLIGARNRVEIWDKSRWEKYQKESIADLEEIAEALSGEFQV